MIKRKAPKTKREKIKQILNSAANITLFAGMGFSSIPIVEEVYENITTENEVIDFDYELFSIIYKNKEDRTPQQLFADIEKAILNIENIDKAIANSQDLTPAQKEKILQDIINVISKEGRLQTNSYEFKKMEDSYGYYFTIYNKTLSVVTKTIYLTEDALTTHDFKKIIGATIHEMIHALENENIMRSEQVSGFDKEVYYKKREFIDYISSFNELVPQLLAADIMHTLEEEYGENAKNVGVNAYVLPNMFMEIMFNLYDVNTSKVVDYNLLSSSAIEKFFKDSENYKLLTIDELIIKGLEKKLNAANIDYKNIDLKDTYYYKNFVSFIDEELLNTTYKDYYDNYKTIGVKNNSYNEIDEVINK